MEARSIRVERSELTFVGRSSSQRLRMDRFAEASCLTRRVDPTPADHGKPEIDSCDQTNERTPERSYQEAPADHRLGRDGAKSQHASSRGRRLVEQGLVKPYLVSGANWFFLAESVERIVKEIRKATEMR